VNGVPLCWTWHVAGLRPVDKEAVKRDFVMLMDVRSAGDALLAQPEGIRNGMPSRRSTIKGTRVHDLRSRSLIYRPQSTHLGKPTHIDNSGEKREVR
jgi:hypothetical protein